jgi:hypothetical protein
MSGLSGDLPVARVSINWTTPREFTENPAENAWLVPDVPQKARIDGRPADRPYTPDQRVRNGNCVTQAQPEGSMGIPARLPGGPSRLGSKTGEQHG